MKPHARDIPLTGSPVERLESPVEVAYRASALSAPVSPSASSSVAGGGEQVSDRSLRHCAAPLRVCLPVIRLGFRFGGVTTRPRMLKGRTPYTRTAKVKRRKGQPLGVKITWSNPPRYGRTMHNSLLILGTAHVVVAVAPCCGGGRFNATSVT